jgi:hypothetical protein
MAGYISKPTRFSDLKEALDKWAVPAAPVCKV